MAAKDTNGVYFYKADESKDTGCVFYTLFVFCDRDAAIIAMLRCVSVILYQKYRPWCRHKNM